MYISPISYGFNFLRQNINDINKPQISFQNTTKPFYPKNYQPYFGARLNRTPENFYAQKFNIDNMPDTVREYLLNDFENNKGKRPMQLQQEAFQWLPECTTIQDVKDMYPNEKLFQNLRTFTDIHPRLGYLNELKYKKRVKSTEVLKSGEEFTLYLLRKIYVEGKDKMEFLRQFVNIIRKDKNGDWSMKYTCTWDILEPIGKNK